MCLPNIAEKMKPYFFFSILFIVFLLLGLNKELAEANRLQQHYWKHVMGDDEPMPDAIKDLLPSTLEGKDPVLRGGNGHAGDSPLAWEDLINKDFDTRSVAIIYHHQDDHHA